MTITDIQPGIGTEAGAVFSECRRYRYLLWRTWDETLPVCTFLMLNASKADAFRLDPTVTRTIGFAKREGCGKLFVVNLFGYRSTDPAELRKVDDPVGNPDNDRHILDAMLASKVKIAAWGNHGSFLNRSEMVKGLLFFVDLFHLGLTAAGEPTHPLYVRGDKPLEVLT